MTYSRNGQFKVDNAGFIVNNQGSHLMGFPADATGTIIPGTATALQMPTAGITPQVTTGIQMEMNLDSRAGVTLPTAGRRSTSPTRRPTTTPPRRRSTTSRARRSR
jgi:flagellar hook protein FlgE